MPSISPLGFLAGAEDACAIAAGAGCAGTDECASGASDRPCPAAASAGGGGGDAGTAEFDSLFFLEKKSTMNEERRFGGSSTAGACASSASRTLVYFSVPDMTAEA